MSAAFDVLIGGEMGLYTIATCTKKARSWVKKHLPDAVRIRGQIACEGGQNCRDIVRGMLRSGLSVAVNGLDMKGFDKASE